MPDLFYLVREFNAIVTAKHAKIDDNSDKMPIKALIIRAMFVLLLLSGCTMVPESTHPVQWQQHQNRLASIRQFQASGKMGYIAPEQRQTLNFHWAHRVDFSEIRFTTLLGQTALKLTMTPRGAQIETIDDEVFNGADATSLIFRLTGLLLPISQLPDWLLGRPQGTEQFTLNAQNTLASLDQQAGQQTPWQIQYSQYQDVPYGKLSLPLPRKLTLREGDTKLNIVVTKWTLTP